MKCPNCGGEVGVQDKFCGSCGFLLQPQNEVLVQNTNGVEKKSKGFFGVIVFLSAVACVMAVAVLFLFFGQGKTLQKESETIQLNPKDSFVETVESPDVTESTEKKAKASIAKETPYWKNYFKVGENNLKKRQQEEMFLLFQKAWTYYGEGEQAHVDISDLDIVSPDDSVKMYAPDKVKVSKQGEVAAIFHIVIVDDSEGSFSAMEYQAEYSMSEDSPYEHFNLLSYKKGKQHTVTSFQKASASSVLKSQGGISYSASNLVDQNSDTAWMEGVSGYGAGSWVKVAASKPYEIYGVAIRNGYNKSDKSYTVNARPKKVKFTFSSKGNFVCTLNDNRLYGEDYTDIILFDEPVQTEYVKMTIQSVYKGNDYYSYDGDDGKACQDMGFDEIFVIH